MKVKVLIPFTDKVTKKTHNAGEIIEVTVARFTEIEKPHYIKPIDADSEKEAAKTDKK